GYYDAYYGQAQKVRTLITRDFAAAFERADVLVSPTTPFVAFQFGARTADPYQMYLADLYTIPSNLYGGPAISVPCGLSEGLPGSLPVANRAAIEATIRIGLALNCRIAEWCRFVRKNYFYPDMPKNFQISQYDEPLCVDGYLDVEVDGELVRVGIERVHLEEDTGKTLHVGGATGRIHGATESLVDYNRAGIPLVEI